jgi:hypothetical protein
MRLLRHILHDVVATMDAEAERDLRGEAQRFLGSLDADSQEGMWFEAFAEGFPSRLAAAVAYVKDMKSPK